MKFIHNKDKLETIEIQLAQHYEAFVNGEREGMRERERQTERERQRERETERDRDKERERERERERDEGKL